MKTAIVVFAKTLGLTPVKTRLGTDIGQDRADVFYALSVKALKTTLNNVKTQVEEVAVFWALAEEDGPEHEYWTGEQVFWTGEGNLGQRLDRVTERLFETHESVIMIGTDSPHLTTKCLADAVQALRENTENAVVGPCTDGGFYLFGSTVALGRTIWTSVTYSQQDTLKQLLERMADAKLIWRSLEPLEDVDHGKDLSILKKAFLSQTGLSNEQENLLTWLKQFD